VTHRVTGLFLKDFQKLERKEPSTRNKNNDDIDYEDPDSDDETIKRHPSLLLTEQVASLYLKVSLWVIL